MARKSNDALLAQNDATITQNVDGSITGNSMNAMIGDSLDSARLGYGVMNLTVPQNSITVTDSTPWIIQNYTTDPIQTSEYTADLSAGTQTIVEPQVLDVQVQMSVNLATNDIINVELYVDGQPSGWAVPIHGSGGSPPVGLQLFGIFDVGLDSPVIDIRMLSDSGNVTMNLLNVAFICRFNALINDPPAVTRSWSNGA